MAFKELNMTRLEDLLYSLTTVIIRYHDIQTNAKKLIAEDDEKLVRKKSRSLAKTIINDKSTDYKTRLDTLIKECTAVQTSRKPLLSYILNEIVLLTSFLEHKESLELPKFEVFKKQVTQLVLDIKTLLSIAKDTTAKITHHNSAEDSDKLIQLEGLIDVGYYKGGSLCNSGLFLKEEVLERFNLEVSSTSDDIKEFTYQLCEEHQNTLLVPELIFQNDQLKDLNSEHQHAKDLQATSHSEVQKELKTTISKQNVSLYLLYIQYSKLKGDNTKQQKKIDYQKKTIDDLNQKVQDLTEEREISSGTGYGTFFGVSL